MSEKKLTPVGTILEWIDEKTKMINDHYESPDHMPLSVRGQLNELINLRKIVRAQLREDQAVIEEAFNEGAATGAEDGGTYYYEETYRQK